MQSLYPRTAAQTNAEGWCLQVPSHPKECVDRKCGQEPGRGGEGQVTNAAEFLELQHKLKLESRLCCEGSRCCLRFPSWHPSCTPFTDPSRLQVPNTASSFRATFSNPSLEIQKVSSRSNFLCCRIWCSGPHTSLCLCVVFLCVTPWPSLSVEHMSADGTFHKEGNILYGPAH